MQVLLVFFCFFCGLRISGCVYELSMLKLIRATHGRIATTKIRHAVCGYCSSQLRSSVGDNHVFLPKKGTVPLHRRLGPTSVWHSSTVNTQNKRYIWRDVLVHAN